MKTTGTKRRFDDLGRIVIPREVRRELDIREGQTMEVFTDSEGRIVLQKCESEEE